MCHCVLLGSLNSSLKCADDERAQLVQLDAGDGLPQTRSSAKSKRHVVHVVRHVVRALLVEPAARVERGDVLAGDLLVLLDDCRVAADNVASWDELAAERHTLLGYDSWQCLGFAWSVRIFSSRRRRGKG